jgi:hypothetical protein
MSPDRIWTDLAGGRLFNLHTAVKNLQSIHRRSIPENYLHRSSFLQRSDGLGNRVSSTYGGGDMARQLPLRRASLHREPGAAAL